MIKKPDTRPKTGCFRACFGSCAGESRYIKPKEKVNSPKWFPKWRRRFISSFKKPVVNVDPKEPVKSSGNKNWEIQVVEEDDEVETATKWTDSVKKQNGSYRSRKRVSEKKQPVVVVSKNIVSTTSLKKPLTHSVSLPILAKEKKVGDGSKIVKKKVIQKYDHNSVIGMSIILVILVIMMLWGKFCAILCTSAWFFIVSWLRAAGKYSADVDIAFTAAEKRRSGNLDLESVEYKKKVVLEGLLQRNNRNVVGRSTRLL